MVEAADLLNIFQEKGIGFYPEEGNFLYCPTGEPYFMVTSGGIKPEGAMSEVFPSEKEAFSAWEAVIGAMIDEVGEEGLVFWRMKPEMKFFESPGGKIKGWTVYSRLRISSKPVIQSADYNKLEGEGS